MTTNVSIMTRELDNTPSSATTEAILDQTKALGFDMVSEPRVGALLATLAASKPRGRFLELGTGTGHGTAWLLSGMDADATLDSVDTDASLIALARAHLGTDPRVAFHVGDGGEFIERAQAASYDLIFADAWPGKFTHLLATLALLRPGGLYVVDDLLEQASWPDGHAARVPELIAALDAQPGFVAARLHWASGLMILARRENV